MLDSAINAKISMAAAAFSPEEIILRIEEGIALYRSSNNPSKLLAASLIWHVKMGSRMKHGKDDFDTMFAELERVTRYMNMFTPNNS